MILEYIWIKKFRVIEETGFNFSTKNKYEYDKESGALNVSLNENFKPDFFNSNISVVTGLIGENGVGKSTLIEFLIINLTNFSNGSAVSIDEGELIAVFTNLIIYRGDNILSNIEEIEASGYKVIPYSSAIMFYDLFDTGYENIAYIHFSNVFDYQRYYDDLPNIIDVSTNELLTEEAVDSNGKSMFIEFVNRELKRQIDCISEFDLKLPFNLPEQLILEVFENVYTYKRIIDDKLLRDKNLENIIECKGWAMPSNEYIKIKKRIYLNLLIYRGYFNPRLYKEMVPNILHDIFVKNFNNLSELNEGFQKEMKKYREAFLLFDELVKEGKFIIRDKEKWWRIDYNIEKDNSTLFEFMKSMNELMGLNPFIFYSWDGISSGEKAYLSLLSRINYAKKRLLEKNEFDIKNIIIFVDEFDLYLHPEWQRLYFNVIQSQLPLIFGEEIKIQLIISSHSPFLVSDLPRENLMLLKKEKGILRIDDPNNMKVTFGANIHKQYVDSFFLKSTIGAFASDKINELIDLLNSQNNISPDSIDEIISFIDLIGEPLIKNKLRNMLFKNFDKEYEISYLKKRLNELGGE